MTQPQSPAKPQAKLRHVAISVPDLEKAAAFYESAFGLKRVNKVETAHGNGISLSDGVVNLTLLNFPTDASAGDERGKDFVGIHHIGFVVDDVEGMTQKVIDTGARFHKEVKAGEKVDFERKFRDPNGVVFDISHTWVGTGKI